MFKKWLIAGLSVPAFLLGAQVMAAGDVYHTPASMYATPGASVLFMECNINDDVLSGGFYSGGFSADVHVIRSEPYNTTSNPQKWRIDFYNSTSSDIFVAGFITCREN